MKIAIIEDEKIHTDYLAEYLQEWSLQRGKPVDILAFISAESFLFAWEEDRTFDNLFVDIQMKTMNGMEMVKKIRERDHETAIVFTTGIDDYLASGYEVDAMHYLLKPLNREKIFQCMDKAAQRQRKETFILLHGRDESIKVSERHISYVEARGHGCIVELCSRPEEVDLLEITDSITHMEEQLASCGFVRCHRSYLCRVGSIRRITRTDILLDSGSTIPISRRMYEQVNQAFIRFFSRGI